MKRLLRLCLLLLLLAGGWWVWHNYFHVLTPAYHAAVYTPEKYLRLKDTLQAELKSMRSAYKAANAEGKSRIIKKAEQEFAVMLDKELFPFWQGTDWEFHGTTEVPGQGSIACGYFVTTLLRDAGVKLGREKLAQCASEQMIKALVSKKNIQRFSGAPISDFVKAVRKSGEGIYVVGLDNHTGFIVCRGEKVKFVHSGGGYPSRVVTQQAENARMLVRSKYRVIGKVSSDETFLRKWIAGERF